MKIQYGFKEDKTLEELKKYIDSTYGQHYGKGNIQATEFVFDSGHGESFCVGNILKYAQRFGKKEGENTADLYKIIHYAIILLGEIEKKKDEDFREYQDQMQVGDTE